MKVTTNLKNIRWGEIPDGVIVKVWFWMKTSRINWAIYSEYKEQDSGEERLEYILRSLANKVEWCVNPELLSGATVDRAKEDEAIDEAKQAIISLIKELDNK